MRGARVKQIRRDLLAELTRTLGRRPRREELPTAGDIRKLKRAWTRRGRRP